MATVPLRSPIGDHLSERQWPSTCKTTLKRSAVLMRPSRLMTASAGNGNIIADIVYRVSGYSVESNAVLVDRFSCPFKTEGTLTAIIRAWVEPGTTIISDCWAAYNNLGRQGYTHHTVNHRIGFVYPTTGAHTNIIESYWHHLKVYVDTYCRKKGYVYQLAQYMLASRCKADNVDPFTVFLHIVVSIDWNV